ncbi:hypothetical protein [Rubripirellula tenax]|nr:hypothetical protein [Rubripirellula tenax]
MQRISRFCFAVAVWWLAALPADAWDRGCDDSQSKPSYEGDSPCNRLSDDPACMGQSLADRRYESLFWVGVDSLWLTHSGSEFRSEILDPGNNAVVVAQTLDHGLPVAPRLRLGTLLLDSVRTELSYFGTDGWESSATLQNVAPLPDLDATIDYDAELHNVEWNFFSGQSEIDSHWMIGLRYLRYRDSFSESYRLDTGFGPLIEETASGEATNDAFGPQAGVGLDLGGGNTLLHLGAKLGLMNNQVRQSGPAFSNAILIDGNPETTFDKRLVTLTLVFKTFG